MAYIQLWSSTCHVVQREEVRNDDHIDNSSSVVFARWRRVGIFSLARLASTEPFDVFRKAEPEPRGSGVYFSTAATDFG